MSTNRWPECLSEFATRINFYGVPMEEPGPAIYTLEGRVNLDNKPKNECIDCGRKGKKIRFKTSPIIATGEWNKD
jgi:hypothetical protein